MNATTISRLQYFFLLCITEICMGPFIYPALLLERTRHHAWMIVLAAYAAAVAVLLLVLRLTAFFPRQNLIEWSRRQWGPVLGGLYAIGAIAVVYAWGILAFAEHWHLTVYTQFRQTPVWIPGPIILLVVYYLLSGRLESWSRLFQLLGPIVLSGIALIDAMQWMNADFGQLLPLTDVRPDELGRPELLLPAAFMFGGFLVLFFLHPNIRDRKRLTAVSLAATTLSFAVLSMSVVLPVSVFGGEEAGQFAYPYLESFETVAFPMLPLEKISFLVPIFWLVIVIGVITVSFHCALLGLKVLLPKAGDKRLLYGLCGAALPLLIWTAPRAELNTAVVYWSAAGVVVFVAAPLLTGTIAALRRNKADERV